jgi:NitT/TauT family transport system permease protein
VNAEPRPARDASLDLALAIERSRLTSGVTRALQAYVYPSLTLAGILVMWQVAVTALRVPIYILPGPIQVVTGIVGRADILFDNARVTLFEILIGFVVSVAIAVPLAVLISYSPVLSRMLYPLLVGAQTIPKVAIAPLFVVWFGYGILPKLMVTVMIAFFPIVVGAVVGLAAMETELLYVARSMGASGWQIFWKIRMPVALPSFFGGLKVGITLAVIGAVVAEFVGADKGLGYLIQLANSLLDTPLLMASVVVLSAIGIVLFLVVERLEALFVGQRGGK